MMHLVEKLGFQLESLECELLQRQAEWQERLRYGLFRSEWQNSD